MHTLLKKIFTKSILYSNNSQRFLKILSILKKPFKFKDPLV